MKQSLEESITESGMEIKKSAINPARGDLFEVDDDLPVLPKKELEMFHSTVAKLLHLSIRARPDLQLALSFLCTRVSKANIGQKHYHTLWNIFVVPLTYISH